MTTIRFQRSSSSKWCKREVILAATAALLVGLSIGGGLARFLGAGALLNPISDLNSLIMTKPMVGYQSATDGQQPKIRQSSSGIDYQTAINALRCFVSPGCFPNKKCRTGEVQRIPRDRQWEERGLCVQDLPKNNTNTKKCIVYSFGLDGNIDWELKMASLFGCEVHGFDPTKTSPNGRGFTFHPWGLQGVGTNMSETHSGHYDKIDSAKLFPLATIMKRLGHDKLDVLMLDCEGCEWGVLRQMACNGDDSSLVDQLLIEAHFQKNLGMASDHDVLVGGEAIRCLEQQRWSIVSLEESGCNPADAEYVGEVAKIVKNPYDLYQIALQRTPPSEPLPWELLRDAANSAAKHSQIHDPLELKYRTANESQWDDLEGRKRSLDAKQTRIALNEKYRAQLKGNRAPFDKPPTFQAG